MNSESQPNSNHLRVAHEATSHQVMGIWLVYSSALKVPMDVVKVAMDMMVTVVTRSYETKWYAIMNRRRS
jgi:hypothetical protein